MLNKISQLKNLALANPFAKAKCILGLHAPCSSEAIKEPARDPELDAMLRKTMELIKESAAQSLSDAHRAAQEGLGPQPWDQDWLENQCCMDDDMENVSRYWSWQAVNFWNEILDMALASPQGQRAIALRGEADNPWQGPLELIDEAKRALLNRSQSLLLQQAKGLGYSNNWMRDLSEALDELNDDREEA
jgi:hypothetical protein